MNLRAVLRLALLIAAVAAAAAPTSQASRQIAFSTEPPTQFSSRAFALRLGELPVTCEGTLSASFYVLVGKTVGLEAARATSLTTTGCRWLLGTATVTALRLESRTPWLIDYRGFLGALPSFSGLRLRVASVAVLVDLSGVLRCLYQGTFEILGTVASGSIASASTTGGGAELALQSEPPGECPRTAGVSSTFSVSPPQGVVLEGSASVSVGAATFERVGVRRQVAVTNGSLARKETIANSGIRIGGANPSAFRWSEPPAEQRPCRDGTELAPRGGSCNLDVTFVGEARAGTYNATLEIEFATAPDSFNPLGRGTLRGTQ